MQLSFKIPFVGRIIIDVERKENAAPVSLAVDKIGLKKRKPEDFEPVKHLLSVAVTIEKSKKN